MLFESFIVFFFEWNNFKVQEATKVKIGVKKTPANIVLLLKKKENEKKMVLNENGKYTAKYTAKCTVYIYTVYTLCYNTSILNILINSLFYVICMNLQNQI